jgi:quercetin dioxygenase-like cupin family protein
LPPRRPLAHAAGTDQGDDLSWYARVTMPHAALLKPTDHAVWRADKMGKSTLFESPRMLVGLNAFEPGQAHALHAHAGMDKLYYVIEGQGHFLLDGSELPMRTGDVLAAPDGVPHGVRNSSGERLLVLAILAPAPGASHA